MRVGICCIAALMGAVGIATDAAAVGESDAGLAEKRGLSPMGLTPAIVSKINKALTDTCTASENPTYTQNAALGGLSPGSSVVNTLRVKYGISVTGEVKAVITQQPSHGKIAMIGMATRSFPGLSLEVFEYTPEKDFLGEDKAVFEVSVNGQKFRISYVIKVVHGGFNDACIPPGGDRGAFKK